MSNGRQAEFPRSLWLPGAGIRVHALDWGGGEPDSTALVLLLHGVGGNAKIWEPVAERLRDSSGHRYRIVALDGRDGGETDHPESGYWPENFAADLAMAHDALGGGPLTIVGHSRAGWLGTWFAQRYPERVERLILVDPARLAFATKIDADRFYDRLRAGLGPFASRIEALTWARSHDVDADWNDARVRSFLAGLTERADGSLVGRLPVPAVEQLRAAREHENTVGPHLAAIACPVLLMVANRQSEARQRDKLAYADDLRNVRVEHVDGSHFLHTDVPDVVADLIGRFLP